MSLASARTPASAARAGRLSCFCPAGAPVAGQARGLLMLAGGFAASVLAQTLVLGLLPLAGLLLAPQPAYAVLPLVAMLGGAALATFPASFLLDAFGRRASFALGASHGIAGGLLMAFALTQQAFGLFLLGAFWMGVAQGFSLFYRHEAAVGANLAQRVFAVGIVFGAGSLAGILGPGLADFAGRIASGFYVGAALAAAGAQALVLAFAAVSARPAPLAAPGADAARPVWSAMAAPTIIAALAWFSMNLLMLAGPFAMIACGIGPGEVMGVVAWHVVAMYAPAFVLAPFAGRINVRWMSVAGLALVVLSLGLFAGAQASATFAAALVVLAIGWALATSAATAWLHEEAAPSRGMLALHDATLFCAAIAGALAAFPFAG